MAKHRLKIVPKSDPNAEGEWIEIDIKLPQTVRWEEIDRLVSRHVPETHYVTKVEKIE